MGHCRPKALIDQMIASRVKSEVGTPHSRCHAEVSVSVPTFDLAQGKTNL
jgi:hypothetical protein